MARLLIVGLGNPGPSYAKTRHNLGAVLVERLAERIAVRLKRPLRAKYRTGDGVLASVPVTLAIPTTYMNESGRPVAALVRKTRVKPEQLVIVHDELDLPLGTVRLKGGGGLAGHNGLKSIRDSLRNQDFLRVRLGIGRPQIGSGATEKVLTTFAPEERTVADAAIELAIKGLEMLARDGLDAAQNLIHAQ